MMDIYKIWDTLQSPGWENFKALVAGMMSVFEKYDVTAGSPTPTPSPFQRGWRVLFFRGRNAVLSFSWLVHAQGNQLWASAAIMDVRDRTLESFRYVTTDEYGVNALKNDMEWFAAQDRAFLTGKRMAEAIGVSDIGPKEWKPKKP